MAMRLSDGWMLFNLEHSCPVAILCIFYKIRFNQDHAQEAVLSTVRVPVRLTSLVVSVHSKFLDDPCYCTVQFSRSFVPT